MIMPVDAAGHMPIGQAVYTLVLWFNGRGWPYMMAAVQVGDKRTGGRRIIQAAQIRTNLNG